MAAINEHKFLDSAGLFDSHSNDTMDLIIANSTLNTANDQTNYGNTILNPPHKGKNRLAKRRQHSSFKINGILRKVEIKEKEKIFKKTSNHQSYQFYWFSINYFKIFTYFKCITQL